MIKKNVLKLDCDDGGITQYMNYKSLHLHLKELNFMKYKLYLSKVVLKNCVISWWHTPFG